MPTRKLLKSLLATAEQRPEAEALLWRREQVTYGSLLTMVREAADRLDAAGVAGPAGAAGAAGTAADDPHRPVTVLPAKSPQTIALMLAAFLKELPVLIPAPSLARPAVQRLHDSVGGSALLSAEPDGISILRSDPASRNGGETSSEGEAQPEGGAWTGRVPTGPRLLLTTSGTTGAPKVVVLNETGVDAFLGWARETFAMGPGASVLSYAPLSFDLSLLEVWAALGAGARVVLADPDRAVDPDYLLSLVRETRPTVIQAVPLVYRLLDEADPDVDETVRATRHVISTGDRLPGELARSVARRFPEARVYNVYGSTETNDSFIHELRAGTAGHEDIPIGQPIAGADYLIEPGTHSELESDGDGAKGGDRDGAGEGELWVATPFQSSGYLDAARGSERFVRRGGRVYFRTGDSVRVAGDGTVRLMGRTDFHTKIRGVRVDLQGVEHVLAGHAEIVEAAVVEVPDPMGGSALHAQVQRAAHARLNGLGIREFCLRSLAREAVPGSFNITEDPLPRTANGKVDRALIKATLIEAH